MKTKFLLTVITMVLAIYTGYAQAPVKQDIRVLFVGFDPDMPIPENFENSMNITGGMAPERFVEDYKTRLPAFKNYLENYFTEVKTVDARNYKMDMSDDYDVTIFDQVIAPWKEAVREMGKDGKMNYEPAKYLTEDFDNATIFIGHTAPVMGRSIGTKLDWLCLCLDADAHHIEKEHPIFSGPFEVELTMVEKPTPEGIYHYASGENVPKQIPMWRVQKEGYMDGKGYRMGMVSRGEGFLDSPDTEYISSGVNTKDVGAVAIGRHGNFFMWGFSGSPDYMTEEAKQVFANAVVYMKQFNGVKPIARKYNDRIATRAYVDNMIHNATKESFADYNKMLDEFEATKEKEIVEIKKKKAAGEELTEVEKIWLQNEGQERPRKTWEDFIKGIAGHFYKEEYIENPKAFHEFMENNREYFYSDPDGSYELKIDEDAKQLGISNRDIAILKKSIALLKEGKDTAMAHRILNRYTTKKFSTPEEWEEWLDKNENDLFFTDAGGYKWMVDTSKK